MKEIKLQNFDHNSAARSYTLKKWRLFSMVGARQSGNSLFFLQTSTVIYHSFRFPTLTFFRQISINQFSAEEKAGQFLETLR